ncbi:MAG: hypothetical protein ABIN74_02475 [Ferruginibacter sp.]
MQFSPARWLKITLFNLLIVASIGVLLRYKILYPLPFVDQKHLLHGHSHFAFAGWITQAIMTLLVFYLSKQTSPAVNKRYRWLLIANLLMAYGMLIAFPIQGYGLYSIIFSTGSVFVSYVFAIMYWRDLDKLNKKHPTHLWFKAAVLFNAFSSLGVFSLAFMMMTKTIHQTWYLAAEYFYLHFQYNGWFFFACMGLLTELLGRITTPTRSYTTIFWLFAGAALPAYFLSTLWMPMPLWVYILVVISAFAQLAGWLWLVSILKINGGLLRKYFSTPAKIILMLSALALTAKLLLQTGSTIPSLSDLAFGFRPIVIGYLHLVLLGVITLFLLGYMFAEKYFKPGNSTRAGIFIFAAGVICNEVLLMVQGVAAISYNSLPFINEMLLGTAFILFSGALLLVFSKRNMDKTEFNHN